MTVRGSLEPTRPADVRSPAGAMPRRAWRGWAVAAALLAAPLLAAPLAAPLAAQQTTGAIAGSVVSAAGVPVGGANVEASSSGGAVRQVVSRDDGSFRMESLLPGPYVVSVRRIGFREFRDTVTVVAGQTYQLRVELLPGARQLEQVVVTGTALPITLLNAPVSINFVDSAAIAERPALTPMDNLRSTPGVDIAQGGLVQSAIVARGFNNAFSGSMLTLIDNRFASVPSLRVNVPFLFTASNEDIERIEVLLGPAAALYGPNSANGVLHIITKSPFTSQGTTLTLDAGERSVVRGAVRHAGTMGGSLGYKLTGEYMRGDDWEFQDPAEPAVFPNTPNTPDARVGQPVRRDFGVEKWGGEARLDYRFGENGTNEWINTYGIVHSLSSLELTGANGTGQVKDWRVQSLQSRLNAGRLFAQLFANFSDAGNEDSTDLSGTYLLRTGVPIVDQSRVMGAQARYSSDFGARQSLVYGVDYIFTDPRTGGTINGRNEEDDEVTEFGGYVQSTTGLGPQWDLLLAARLDRHSRLEGTFFSPRAAVVYKPDDVQRWRLTFNRAYSTPANFSFFLDLLQAANVSGLPYNVRAVGVPESGFTFRRDCTGGVGSLCMRSPFTPTQVGGAGQFVPANAAAYYPAALQVALAGGLRNGLLQAGLSGPQADAVIARLGTFNAVGANVGTSLRYITAPAGAPAVSPDQIVDLERLKASYTNVLELGYKALLGDKLRLAVDGWYQRRENFTTPAVNFTPNALLDGASLGAGLAAHLAPVVGPAAAAQLAPVIAGSLARIPLGTVVPDSRVTTNGDIAFTYLSIDKSIDLYGADLAFDYLFTPSFTVLGTYSWVSDVEFPEIESGQRPLTLNAPDHKASLTLRYDWQPRNVSMELRGRYQNTFPVNSAVFVTGVPLPGPNGVYEYQQPPTASFLDAQVVWRLPFRAGQGALLSISGTNLLNNEVPLFAGVPEIGRLIMTRLQVTF